MRISVLQRTWHPYVLVFHSVTAWVFLPVLCNRNFKFIRQHLIITSQTAMITTSHHMLSWGTGRDWCDGLSSELISRALAVIMWIRILRFPRLHYTVVRGFTGHLLGMCRRVLGGFPWQWSAFIDGATEFVRRSRLLESGSGDSGCYSVARPVTAVHILVHGQ